MNETPDRSPPERREVFERHETVTESPADAPLDRSRADRRDLQAATYWLWLVPLLLVVVGLVWFILTRGEPRSPLEGMDVDVTTPRVEPPPPEAEPTIQLPAPDPPATSPAPEPDPPPTTTPGEGGQ